MIIIAPLRSLGNDNLLTTALCTNKFCSINIPAPCPHISTCLHIYVSTYLHTYLLAVYGWWVDTNDDAVRCRVVTLSRWVTGRYCHVSRRQGGDIVKCMSTLISCYLKRKHCHSWDLDFWVYNLLSLEVRAGPPDT